MKSVLYVLDYLILRKVVDNYHYRTIGKLVELIRLSKYKG